MVILPCSGSVTKPDVKTYRENFDVTEESGGNTTTINKENYKIFKLKFIRNFQRAD